MSGKKVLISGLGIAGPTLAFWLKATGFQPTLVEHAPLLRSGGYVIDFWGLGYDIAERMGFAMRSIGLAITFERCGLSMNEADVSAVSVQESFGN